MRTLYLIVMLLLLAQTGQAHDPAVEEKEEILSVLTAFIRTPVRDFSEAKTLLENAGFVEGGYDPTGTWFWQHPNLGAKGRLDFEDAWESVDDGEITGPAWYRLLGFRGVSLSVSADRSLAGLSAFALPSGYLPDLVHHLTAEGYALSGTNTRITTEFDTDGTERCMMVIRLRREDNGDEFSITQTGDFCVAKFFLAK